MKKEVVSPFDIKLEFDKSTENPSRLFQSFAELIDSISRLDTVIAKTVNTTVSAKIYLDDFEKGSLIAKLWNELILNDDNKIDDVQSSEPVSEYIEEARAASLNYLSNGKSSVTELQGLNKEIKNIADKKDLAKSFNYVDVDLLELASALNEVNNSTDKLTDKEKYTVTSPNTDARELKAGTPKIDIEAVENALTSDTITNTSQVYYKIKRPDFLGDSQWEFKFGNKNIKAKILHEEWLTKFHNGEVVVVPGDSLRVKVKQVSKYNKNGYLISDKIEIVEVLGIKRNKEE
ncbi:hypothetical protein C8N40_110130 [Pontibacter mucosus]|uniref:Uncharacterized protein n=2 Tax=Pontibacter mucosus TaxID=1649266 RepID=A0A2T5YDS8_9BACT|nr:hypothetical protein C8N40_110130 [Pontibacter mucosus]